MAASPEGGFTGPQRTTLLLTAASAALVLISGALVWSALGAVDATPGFVEFAVLAVLVVGMARRIKIAYLGTLGAKGIFVLAGVGAFAVRPAAFTLSWFAPTLVLNILLGFAIVYFAWRALKEM